MKDTMKDIFKYIFTSYSLYKRNKQTNGWFRGYDFEHILKIHVYSIYSYYKQQIS